MDSMASWKHKTQKGINRVIYWFKMWYLKRQRVLCVAAVGDSCHIENRQITRCKPQKLNLRRQHHGVLPPAFRHREHKQIGHRLKARSEHHFFHRVVVGQKVHAVQLQMHQMTAIHRAFSPQNRLKSKLETEPIEQRQSGQRFDENWVWFITPKVERLDTPWMCFHETHQLLHFALSAVPKQWIVQKQPIANWPEIWLQTEPRSIFKLLRRDIAKYPNFTVKMVQNPRRIRS